MDRLKFTYSFEVNRQMIEYPLPSYPSIVHHFFICFGLRVFNWEFEYSHDRKTEYNTSWCVLKPETPNDTNPIDALPKDCNCKFTIKRVNHPDIKCTIAEKEKWDCWDPKFIVPEENAIFKYFINLIEDPKEIPAVLEIELELPKSFFTLMLPKELKLEPDGWKKDELSPLLTVKDKHDFHIVCTDGVYCAKKRALKRNSGYFNRKFENEWKDKSEVKLDISLETMKVITTYLFTETVLIPEKMDLESVKELIIFSSEFKFECTKRIMKTLDVLGCRQIGDVSLSLHDLISWWTFAKECHGLQALIESILNKKHYSEIMNQYKPNMKFTDSKKKDIHRMLHEKDNSLFERLKWFHGMNEKVTMVEVANKK